MPAPVPIALGMRSNPSRHGGEGAARLINCYAEQVGEEGRVPWPVYAIEGHEAFATLTGATFGVRAMLEMDSVLYVVAGRLLFSVDQFGGVTTIGAVPADGLVTMARNRRSPPEIGIATSSGSWYIFQSGAIAAGSDTDLPSPNSVCELDGYLVFTIQDGRIFASDYNIGSAIDPLSFTTADANADGLLRGVVRGRDLCCFGPKSVQFYQNVGAEDFPFALTTSASIGCYAAGSVVPLTAAIGGSTVDTVIWAATNSAGAFIGVMMLNGYQGTKISPVGLDRLIAADPSPALIRAYSRAEGGTVFYKLTGTSWTWAYNTATGFWHEEQSYGSTRSRFIESVTFNGRQIVGDIDAGLLTRSGPTLYDEAGDLLIMAVQPPAVHAYPYRMKHNALHVDVVPGVGLNSTDPALSDPQIMIDYSEDGGRSFAAERRLSIGAMGEHGTRVVTRRLGRARQQGRTYRLRMSAAHIKGIAGLALDAQRLNP